MKTIVELSVLERIADFYFGAILAHPNTLVVEDAFRYASKVYSDLMKMCGQFTLPRVPRIKQWRDAGYLELFSIKTEWCFGYRIEILGNEPIRHIYVCEKSENIR